MQQPVDRAPWRANFVGALGLLARAAARVPFGVPDPVLSGASAVELYSGSLWSAAGLEVLAEDAARLTAELFTVGFRWTQRPRHLGPGLWHPELQIGIDIIDRAPLGAGALSNLLTVAVDLGTPGPADREPGWLKVIGIEDVIVDQVRRWLLERAPVGGPGLRLQALVGLGQEGVGGGFRGGYLQRRLARETGGEVVLESLSTGDRWGQVAAPRVMTLTGMQAAVMAWRDRWGLSLDPPVATGEGRGCSHSVQINPYRNDRPGRAGWSGSGVGNIVPFDLPPPAPPGA
jgi:hypothetical protein